MRRLSLALGCLIVLSWGVGARAEIGKVALTFDDLPGLSLAADQAYVNALNDALLRGLKKHRLPAIGFVNEGKLDEIDRPQQIANLQKWLDAGMSLGNHTFSHESPNSLGGPGYIDDIVRGEPIIRGLLRQRSKPLVWFRHPYLETGVSAQVRRQINDWLQSHGYRIAPVTIDAEDWEFAEPYDKALLQHDEARRRRIKRQYLAYTARTIAWYQKSSQALFHRKISLVMLLHATRLNADSIDAMAKILRRSNLRGVTLEEALEDPAYGTPDQDGGPDGADWIERWAYALHKTLPWDSWRDPPCQIVAECDQGATDKR